MSFRCNKFKIWHAGQFFLASNCSIYTTKFGTFSFEMGTPKINGTPHFWAFQYIRQQFNKMANAAQHAIVSFSKKDSNDWKKTFVLSVFLLHNRQRRYYFGQLLFACFNQPRLRAIWVSNGYQYIQRRTMVSELPCHQTDVKFPVGWNTYVIVSNKILDCDWSSARAYFSRNWRAVTWVSNSSRRLSIKRYHASFRAIMVKQNVVIEFSQEPDFHNSTHW